jgi:hypothetical protein
MSRHFRFFRMTLVTMAGLVLVATSAIAGPTTTPTATPSPSPLPCLGVDHYKVYSLAVPPDPPTPFAVRLQDQLGDTSVFLDFLGYLGVPVMKAISPNPPQPLGELLCPSEHLTWYRFFEPHRRRTFVVDNQFGTATWTTDDAGWLLVPALKDGEGAIQREQHWKCYDALAPSPGVVVNLLDQFRLESDLAVGMGRFLCNPTEKNNEGVPVFKTIHLACYELLGSGSGSAPTVSLDDQFDELDLTEVLVTVPELLCVPSVKVIVPTPTPSSNCCFGRSNPPAGCDDPTCEMTICDFDPFCCEVSWDEICVESANVFCPVCTEPQPTPTPTTTPTATPTPEPVSDCLCEVKNIFPGGTVANISLSGKPVMFKTLGVQVNAVDAVQGSNLCPGDPEGPVQTAEAVVSFLVTDESGNVLANGIPQNVTCVSGIENPVKAVVQFGPENCGPGGGNVGTFDIYSSVSGTAGNSSRTQRIRCRR